MTFELHALTTRQWNLVATVDLLQLLSQVDRTIVSSNITQSEEIQVFQVGTAAAAVLIEWQLLRRLEAADRAATYTGIKQNTDVLLATVVYKPSN